jgi:nitrogen regulatory protein PII
MKRLEAVIAPWTLDTFKETALELGISEFNIVEVRRCGGVAIESQKRLYRGQEHTVDFLPRLKLEFVLFEDDVKATLHQLLELVHPESIAVFKVDKTVCPTDGDLSDSQSPVPTANRPPLAAASAIVGYIPRRGNEGSNLSVGGPIRTTADVKIGYRS